MDILYKRAVGKISFGSNRKVRGAPLWNRIMPMTAPGMTPANAFKGKPATF